MAAMGHPLEAKDPSTHSITIAKERSRKAREKHMKKLVSTMKNLATTILTSVQAIHNTIKAYMNQLQNQYKEGFKAQYDTLEHYNFEYSKMKTAGKTVLEAIKLATKVLRDVDIQLVAHTKIQCSEIVCRTIDEMLKPLEKEDVLWDKSVLEAISLNCEYILRQHIYRSSKEVDARRIMKGLKRVKPRSQRFIKQIRDETRNELITKRQSMNSIQESMTINLSETCDGVTSQEKAMVENLITLLSATIRELEHYQNVNLTMIAEQYLYGSVKDPLFLLAKERLKLKFDEVMKIFETMEECTKKMIQNQVQACLEFTNYWLSPVDTDRLIQHALRNIYNKCKDEESNVTKEQMVQIFEKTKSTLPPEKWTPAQFAFVPVQPMTREPESQTSSEDENIIGSEIHATVDFDEEVSEEDNSSKPQRDPKEDKVYQGFWKLKQHFKAFVTDPRNATQVLIEMFREGEGEHLTDEEFTLKLMEFIDRLCGVSDPEDETFADHTKFIQRLAVLQSSDTAQKENESSALHTSSEDVHIQQEATPFESGISEGDNVHSKKASDDETLVVAGLASGRETAKGVEDIEEEISCEEEDENEDGEN